MRVMEDLTVKKQERSETQDTVAVCPGVFFFIFLFTSIISSVYQDVFLNCTVFTETH